MRKITTATVLLVVLLMGCSSGEPQATTVDIEATVEARVATAVASQEEVAVTATSDPTPEIVYEWDQIASEYAKNRIKAHNKYQWGEIAIKGTIGFIDEVSWDGARLGKADDVRSWEDLPTVVLEISSSIPKLSLIDGLFCGLDSVDRVVDVSVGDTVVIEGRITEFESNVGLFVYPCSLQD